MAPLCTSAISIGSTSLTNLSSSRHRPPSLVQREEGWTEVWGGKDLNENAGCCLDGDGCGKSPTKAIEKPYLPPRYTVVMKDGSDFIGGETNRNEAGEGTSNMSSDQHGQHMLELRQYRVAWLEQVVLRMNYIPHTVENSSYAATESTGGLPYLLDLSSRNGGISSNVLEGDDVAKWGRAWKKSLSQLNKPVLIGRNQPGGLGSNIFNHSHEDGNIHLTFLPSGSHIVDYLRLKYSDRMRSNLLFHEHLQGSKFSGDAMAYESLIQDKLNYILLAMRYGNDPAWEGVSRPQCIRATLNPHGTNTANAGAASKLFFPLWAWYQTFSERALALHSLLPSTHATPSTHGGLPFELFRYNDYRCSSESSQLQQESDEDSIEENNVHQHHPFSSFFPSYGGSGGGDTGKVNVYRALESADAIYLSLEKKLASQQQSTYFLGTEKPTYIDVLLFVHLAEALCDVHLILVLAKHSCLMKYFQWIHSDTMGKEYSKAWKLHSAGQGADESADWIEKNDAVNALNAFNQIVPPPTPASIDADGHDIVRAVQLMHKMAVHSNNLEEVLRDAVVLRTAEGKEKAVMENLHRPIGSRLYRWIMEGEVSFWGSVRSTNKTDTDKDEDSQSSRGDNEEPSSKEDDAKQRLFKEHMEQMKRDRRTHDELWLSSVVVAVVAVLVISASGKTR